MVEHFKLIRIDGEILNDLTENQASLGIKYVGTLFISFLEIDIFLP